MIRAIVQQVVEGFIKRFSASGRADETISNREYFQHYGFTSRPKAGAEAILVQEGNHIVMIASDDRRYRLALKEGEAAFYDDLGQKIHLTRDGIEAVSPLKINASAPEIHAVATVKITQTAPLIELTAETKISAMTPLFEISGNIELGGGFTGGMGAGGGDISTSGDVYDGVRSMAEDREIYNGHTHNDPQGGAVQPPNEEM